MFLSMEYNYCWCFLSCNHIFPFYGDLFFHKFVIRKCFRYFFTILLEILNYSLTHFLDTCRKTFCCYCYSNASRAPPVEYDYEMIHSLSIYGCELGRTTKEGLRSWNMTVQYWLAAYCHHRLPHSLKAYR